MAVFTAIILILLWLLQSVFLGKIHKMIKEKELKETAKELSSLSGAPFILEENAELIARENSVCVIVYRIDDTGKANRILSCDILPNCKIHSLDDSDILSLHEKAKLSGGSITEYYSTKLQTDQTGVKQGSSESVMYAFIVKDTRGNDLLFVMNSFIAPLGATLKTLNQLIWIIGAAMIILSVILTLLLSRKITKPIQNINSMAKELAKGNYTQSFQGGSYREANELADTLNYTASELSRVEKLRSELIANTSHDLRTPLTMITGYAELMRDFNEEYTPENAQIIIDESKRLTSLVNDMLEISKLENGSVSLNNETFNLTAAVADELDRYSEFCKKDGYTLRFEASESITVTTDKSKLLRALINLVNNAITYTGDDKLVIVRQERYPKADSGKQVLRLSVIDTGEGIPEDKLDLIWDRYYKIDGIHRRQAHGSGLGLSIVNKLMYYIGGSCGVMSSVGRGSIFWIEIFV